MTRRIDGTPSGDQQDTAVLPAVEVPELAPPVKPARHRRKRRVSAEVLVGAGAALVGVAALLTAVMVLTSRDGGVSREQTNPPLPASSSPHPVIVAPPSSHTPHPARRTAPRRVMPAAPVPAASRSSATPRPSASAKPKPSVTHTITPAPSLTVTPSPVTQTPVAVDNTSSKETTPCPA